MPTASNKNFKTLNHIYNIPVPQHRDFVRENKENVRSKTKNQQTKEKNQASQIDSYMPFSSSAERISSRSSGWTTRFTDAIMQHEKTMPTSTPDKRKMPTKKQPWTYGRESSDRQAMQKTTKAVEVPVPKRPFPTTKTKVISFNKTKVNTSNIAVQTDEINDEMYLYNALKKCASPAFKSALKSKYLQKDKESTSKQNNYQDITLPLDDDNEFRSNVGTSAVHHAPIRQTGGDVNVPIKQTNNQQTETAQIDFIQDSQRTAHKYGEYMQDNLNVMTMPAEGVSCCSPSKCPNCPVGYHLLSEKEREAIKAKLLNHEALLIKQLNSFPLAIETLRVRQSKTRIEKELSVLEQNLRKLTKRKVYAKINIA